MESPKSCPVVKIAAKGIKREDIIRLVESSRAMLLLIGLSNGPANYNSLQRGSKLNPKLLTDSLRELAQKGFVSRRVMSKNPRLVMYQITRKGRMVVATGCPLLEYNGYFPKRPRTA